MRKSLVAGNWKMNGTRGSVSALVEGLKSGAKDISHVDIAVCPPFVFIPEVTQSLAKTAVKVGSQNAAKEASGAYTGEVSVVMIKDFGCQYIIVGHSERRALYGESDQIVAEKFKAVVDGGLTPILCVGELLDERETGKTEAVVERQLAAVLELSGIARLSKAVIAYEPVWAIGTGRTATPEQAQEVHAFIRRWLASHDKSVANSTRIVYGGSVKGNNAAALFQKPDIDGGLIGGASLDVNEFLTICRAAK